MTANRVLIAVLLLNLFATMLVFRGMQILVDRADQPACAASAPGVPAPTSAEADVSAHDALAPPVDSGVNRGGAPNGTATAPPAGTPVDIAPEDPPVLQVAAEEMASGMDDVEGIKSDFEDQYGDSAWTSQVDQVFRGIVLGNPNFIGVTQELIECRERVCKLTLAYADAAQFDQFIEELTMALNGDLSASLYFEEPSTVAGNSRLDVYLVREQVRTVEP